MSDVGYNRAIFGDPASSIYNAVCDNLSDAIARAVQGLFTDFEEVAGIMDDGDRYGLVENLRSALNSLSRDPNSWWPPVQGPIKDCIDWQANNIGFRITSRVVGSRNELHFRVRFDHLDRLLAAAFDPPPNTETLVEVSDNEVELVCMVPRVRWLEGLAEAEICKVQEVVDEWCEDWEFALRLRLNWRE